MKQTLIPKEKLYIATFSKDALELASQYGLGLEINDLCISSNLDPAVRPKVIERISQELKAQSCSGHKILVHGPFTELTPAAIDHRAIELMDERYDESIEICQQIGAKDLILHDGYLPLIYQKPWHKKKSIEYWKRLSDRLPDNMTIYIENVFDDEPELLTEIVAEVNRENMKICLDVGHANCMTIPEFPLTKWIQTMAPHLGHFHIHNNDGKTDLHNDIFQGTLDIETILDAASKYLKEVPTFTIESRDAGPSVEYLMSCQETNTEASGVDI